MKCYCLVVLSALIFSGCSTTNVDNQEVSESMDASPVEEAQQEEQALAEPSQEQECASLDDFGEGEVDLEADLNGNSRHDVIKKNVDNCSARGCFNSLVLAACEGGGYEAVAEVAYFQIVEVGEGSTNGWRDLRLQKTHRDDDGLLESTFETYVWDGETYRRQR